MKLNCPHCGIHCHVHKNDPQELCGMIQSEKKMVLELRNLCGRLAEALVAEHGDQYTANEICECDICNLIAEGRKARDGG
jgi:hypothetical protein